MLHICTKYYQGRNLCLQSTNISLIAIHLTNGNIEWIFFFFMYIVDHALFIRGRPVIGQSHHDVQNVWAIERRIWLFPRTSWFKDECCALCIGLNTLLPHKRYIIILFRTMANSILIHENMYLCTFSVDTYNYIQCSLLKMHLKYILRICLVHYRAIYKQYGALQPQQQHRLINVI